MRYFVVIGLIVGAIGWALLAGEPGGQQVAAADPVPRQLSQIGR